MGATNDMIGIVAGIAKSVPGSAAEAAVEAQQAAEAAAAEAQEILESIPEDYSELSADVGDLKSNVEEVQGALIDTETVTSVFAQYSLWSSQNKQLRTENGYGMYFFNLTGGETIRVTVSDNQVFRIFGINDTVNLSSLPTNIYYDDVISNDDTLTEYQFTNTSYHTIAVYIGSLTGYTPVVTISQIIIASVFDKLNKNQGVENAGKQMVVDSSGDIVPGNVSISVDGEFSTFSENPLQNKVISAEIGGYKTSVPVTVTTKDYGLYSSSNKLKSENGYKSHFFKLNDGDVVRIKEDNSLIFALIGFSADLDLNNLGSQLTYDEMIVRDDDPDSHVEYVYKNTNNYKTLVFYSGNSSNFSITVEKLSNFKSNFYQGTENAGASVIVDESGMITGAWKTYYPLAYDKDYSWFSWWEYMYSELLANVYEPLRTAMPYYITREVIGRDQSDTYDIYAYTFEPERYEQVIYLQSGVHSREAFGYVTLARIMQKIANASPSDEFTAYLRYRCKIVVVPVVNVWGCMQSWPRYNDKNSAGVDLNTDVITNTQAETQAVRAFFTNLNDEEPVSFAFDLHTTVNNSYGDYMGTFWSACDNREIGLQTLWNLARKNCKERSAEYLATYSLEPTDLRILYAGNSNATTTYAYWWKTIDVNGSTVEHSDNVWTDVKFTAKAAEKALENYATQIINHAREKFVKTYGGQTSQEWD